jgi:hypothetical protein
MKIKFVKIADLQLLQSQESKDFLRADRDIFKPLPPYFGKFKQIVS